VRGEEKRREETDFRKGGGKRQEGENE